MSSDYNDWQTNEIKGRDLTEAEIRAIFSKPSPRPVRYKFQPVTLEDIANMDCQTKEVQK